MMLDITGTRSEALENKEKIIRELAVELEAKIKEGKKI